MRLICHRALGRDGDCGELADASNGGGTYRIFAVPKQTDRWQDGLPCSRMAPRRVDGASWRSSYCISCPCLVTKRMLCYTSCIICTQLGTSRLATHA